MRDRGSVRQAADIRVLWARTVPGLPVGGAEEEIHPPAPTQKHPAADSGLLGAQPPPAETRRQHGRRGTGEGARAHRARARAGTGLKATLR